MLLTILSPICLFLLDPGLKGCGRRSSSHAKPVHRDVRKKEAFPGYHRSWNCYWCRSEVGIRYQALQACCGPQRHDSGWRDWYHTRTAAERDLSVWHQAACLKAPSTPICPASVQPVSSWSKELPKMTRLCLFRLAEMHCKRNDGFEALTWYWLGSQACWARETLLTPSRHWHFTLCPKRLTAR